MGFGPKQMVTLSHHRRTGCAGGNDGLLFVEEDGFAVSGDFTGFLPISGVERGLSTASLAFIEMNFAAKMLQNLDGCDAHVSVVGIAQTSQHQVDWLTGYRRKPSLLPPSTVITQPVVRLLRASLASQQIASAQLSGVTTVPRSERLA